jgi:hypothetical protein
VDDDRQPGLEDKTTIPKPRGLLSRPGAGGYSLISVLGWDRMVYKSVQVCQYNNLSCIVPSDIMILFVECFT